MAYVRSALGSAADATRSATAQGNRVLAMLDSRSVVSDPAHSDPDIAYTCCTFVHIEDMDLPGRVDGWLIVSIVALDEVQRTPERLNEVTA